MKILDWLKSKNELIIENRSLRKKNNTIKLQYETQTHEFLEFTKTELRFAKKYEEQLELNKQLKTELRNLKKELADERIRNNQI